jgi:tetratricopeptide (TPR) repeat protein
MAATRPSGELNATRGPRLSADDLTALDDARGLCLANRYAEALRKVEPVVKRWPGSLETWLLRTRVLLGMNQLDAALTSVVRATRIDVEDVEALKLKVRILSAMKKDVRAVEIVDRLLALAPRDPEVHRIRGDCLVAAMRQVEAVFAYEKVIHYLPDDAAAWVALGRTLRQLRRPAEARMALMKAIAITEESAPDIATQARDLIARLPPEA